MKSFRHFEVIGDNPVNARCDLISMQSMAVDVGDMVVIAVVVVKVVDREDHTIIGMDVFMGVDMNIGYMNVLDVGRMMSPVAMSVIWLGWE